MKKIFCGTVISLIGTVFSITLIVVATMYDIHTDSQGGLLGLLKGYHVDLPFAMSLIFVVVGLTICIWGAFEKKRTC